MENTGNITNLGYCHCCRRNVVFESKNSWLRDNYFCLACKSIPRQRHIQYVLDTFFSGWETKLIHESSPSNQFISQFCPNYTYSQFFADTSLGMEKNGVRCENLEDLKFTDNSFDIFITQDVFEHIFNPEMAARQIMRVLKPGGVHLFTAPKHKDKNKSYPRAKILDDKIQYLHEEQYHGNPVGNGQSLVTWDYGKDFEFILNRWTQCPVVTYATRDRSLGIDAEFNEVFVIKKTSE